MTAPPVAGVGGRLRSAVLVGRDAELATAVPVVAAPPSVLVVEGEAGIGKSRLVTEVQRHPDLADRRFGSGGCHPIREPFPLGPVLEAARGLGEALRSESLSPVAGALRPLLPEIADRLPPPLPPLGDRLADRHRVFRGLVALLDAAGPAALVLEDLHWADEQTVDFLGYLLADPPRRLSLVLTYRGEDVDPAVRALTARVPDRVTHAHVLVGPLDAAQTGALAAAILGTGQISSEFAGYLCERASGLPLAIEELLALLRARGALVPHGKGWARRALDRLDVPRGIRDPVLERASRLSSAGRSMLEAAAVLQLPVEPPVLAATAALPLAAAQSGLAEALDSGLLSWQDGRISFRHALALQAVYEQIAPLGRRQLHAHAAAALAGLNPPPLGQLAHHLRRAGDVEAWVAAAEHAADQAAELDDHAEAYRLLAEVLRAAPQLPAERHGRLAAKLGWAATRAARLAAPDTGELLAAAEDRPELPRALRGELRFLQAMEYERTGHDPAAQRRAFAAAVADLAGRPELQALAMIGLAVPRVPTVSPTEHARWLDRALDTGAGIEDSGRRFTVLGKVAMLRIALGDARWRGLAEQIRAGFHSDRQDGSGLDALASVGGEACYAGHHRFAGELLTDALGRAVAAGKAVTQLMCRRSLALLGYLQGDWHGLAEQAAQLVEELRDHAYLRRDVEVAAACLALARGELDAAASQLDGLVPPAGAAVDVDLLPIALTGHLRLALARGEATAAAAWLPAVVTGWETHRVLPPAVRALPAVVETMLAAGQQPQARALVGRWARKLLDLDAPLAPAALSHARGSLAVADGADGLAGGRFQAAAQRYETLRCPYEAAQAREQAARAWFAAGDPRAQPAIRAALDGYQALGAAWDLDRAASLARQLGLAPPARHRAGRRGYGLELSPREREVAELVATGRTNREIARELYLSTKTVDKHISAALRKLGLPSRAALAHRIAAGSAPAAVENGQSLP